MADPFSLITFSQSLGIGDGRILTPPLQGEEVVPEAYISTLLSQALNLQSPIPPAGLLLEYATIPMLW